MVVCSILKNYSPDCKNSDFSSSDLFILIIALLFTFLNLFFIVFLCEGRETRAKSGNCSQVRYVSC
jgi:hypothetical protein